MINQNQEKKNNLIAKKRKRSNSESSEESEQEKFFSLPTQSIKTQNNSCLPKNNQIAVQNFNNKFKVNLMYLTF